MDRRAVLRCCWDTFLWIQSSTDSTVKWASWEHGLLRATSWPPTTNNGDGTLFESIIMVGIGRITSKRRQRCFPWKFPESSSGMIHSSQIRTMVLDYLPTWLGHVIGGFYVGANLPLSMRTASGNHCWCSTVILVVGCSPDTNHGAGIFTHMTGPFLGFLCR